MKAVTYTQYGSPDVLKITRQAIPVPQKHELLIRVKATAVHSADIRVRALKIKGVMRLLMRLVLGWRKPRVPIPGVVFSGIVVKTGAAVSCFKPGDEVFGSTGLKFGCCAEYLCTATQHPVALKPSTASFEEAAAIIFGGQTALYFLQEAGIEHQKKARILVLGAAGVVGMAAIQIARHHEALITAVCNSRSAGRVAGLGVPEILRYDKGELASHTRQYDIIFDASGKYKRRELARLLTPKGVFKTVGGMAYAKETKTQLELLCRLFEQKKYRCFIDSIYPIEQIVAAHQRVETGANAGTVVVTLTA